MRVGIPVVEPPTATTFGPPQPAGAAGATPLKPAPFADAADATPTIPNGRSANNTASRWVQFMDIATLPRPSSKFAPIATEAVTIWPSLSPVIERFTSTSTPSKSFFSTKLITPDIASEPYTVDAPPVRMSTRSNMACGTVEISTTPLML